MSYIVHHLARVECMAGNWEQAARYAEECHETMAQTGQEEERPYALAIGAFVSAHRGLVEATRSATDEGLPLALRVGVLPAYFELLAVRGFLELSLGNPAEAHHFLGPLPQSVRKSGFGEPALFRFHGDAIETLLVLGRTEEATTLLAELEEQGTALQRVWALAVASRCRALLSAASGEIERADTELEHALELHDRLGEPFERARTLLVRGTIQRWTRKKRAARESLQAALAVFDSLGARLWSTRPARSWHGSAAERLDRDIDTDRRAGRCPRRRRSHVPRGGRRALHQPQDRAVEPLEDLPQARHSLTRGARGQARPARRQPRIRARQRRSKPSHSASSRAALIGKRPADAPISV